MKIVQNHGQTKIKANKAPEPLKAEFFDVERARYLLANKNNINRPFKPNKIKEYTQAMNEGVFHSRVSSAICFDKNGQLKNGQTRLASVVESGQAWDQNAITKTGK